MAIVAGTKSHFTPPGGITSFTGTTHSQDVGSGGYLVVVVASMSDTGRTITGVTWNGVSMTQAQQSTVSCDGANTRLAMFTLANPATGTQNLVVNWSGTMDFGSSVSVYSFTGATTGGNSLIGTPTITPNIQTMSMSTNSMILGVSLSRYSQSNIELP